MFDMCQVLGSIDSCDYFEWYLSATIYYMYCGSQICYTAEGVLWLIMDFNLTAFFCLHAKPYISVLLLHLFHVGNRNHHL